MSTIELERQITAARKRGNPRELERLQAQYRMTVITTAQSRGHRLPHAGVAGGSSVRPGVRGIRSATWTPAGSRLVQDDAPKPLVLISQRALGKIKEMRHDLEDGGWLVGPRYQSARAIEAADSIWRADEADREARSLVVRFDELDQIDEARRPKACVVGHWHSQPSGSDPSPQDIQLWANALDHTGRDAFVGVTVRERLTGAIDMQAFVFTKENGATVHRSANIYPRSS